MRTLLLLVVFGTLLLAAGQAPRTSMDLASQFIQLARKQLSAIFDAVERPVVKQSTPGAQTAPNEQTAGSGAQNTDLGASTKLETDAPHAAAPAAKTEAKKRPNTRKGPLASGNTLAQTWPKEMPEHLPVTRQLPNTATTSTQIGPAGATVDDLYRQAGNILGAIPE